MQRGGLAEPTKKQAGFRHSGGKCKIKGEDFQSGFTKRLHWRKTIAQSFTSILRGHGRGGVAVGVQSWCSQGKHNERPRAEKVPGIWKTFVLRKSEENMMKKITRRSFLTVCGAVAAAAALSACGGSASSTTASSAAASSTAASSVAASAAGDLSGNVATGNPGYRGKSGEVATQYSNMHTDPNEKFYIPENVYIIGTMNDIDRSVDSFDFAMRRRFRFVEVRAEDTQDMLESLEDEELKTEAIARMDKLNAEIIRVADLNENYQIGASYFLKLKVLGFDDLWTDYLQPLLQDYVRGLNDEEECMRRFAKAYGYTASGEGDSDEAAIN